MQKKECPVCGEQKQAAQNVCMVCNPETYDANKPAQEKIDSKSFKGECPACGANINKEQPSCPICSPDAKM